MYLYGLLKHSEPIILLQCNNKIINNFFVFQIQPKFIEFVLEYVQVQSSVKCIQTEK